MQRRNTRQRQLVLEAVRRACDHPTADEIYLTVRQHDERISRGTVYRNLNLLADEGVIQLIKAPGGSRFDGRTDRHAHLVCSACGAVSDLDLPYDDALDRDAAAQTDYAGVVHYTLFEGICPTCARGDEASAEMQETAVDGDLSEAQR